jgi:hypothetical protein
LYNSFIHAPTRLLLGISESSFRQMSFHSLVLNNRRQIHTNYCPPSSHSQCSLEPLTVQSRCLCACDITTVRATSCRKPLGAPLETIQGTISVSVPAPTWEERSFWQLVNDLLPCMTPYSIHCSTVKLNNVRTHYRFLAIIS